MPQAGWEELPGTHQGTERLAGHAARGESWQ